MFLILRMNMDFFIYLLVIVFLIIFVFILIHLRPLYENEILQLSTKRRMKHIRAYFAFSRGFYDVNMDFKRNMNANGKFYNINEWLKYFPSYAAALLKYKKHEWIIIAFEKNRIIDFMWLNKGVDSSRVYNELSIDDVVNTAMVGNYSSVLILHNHPNPNPYYYDYTNPSNTDFNSANKYACTLNRRSVNLIEFVCERGSFFEYYFAPCESFYPVKGFIYTVRKANGKSKLTNLSMHVERIFSN